MKSTSRFLSIFLLLVVPCITACTQTVDIYFHPDESWLVKSRLNFSTQEMMLFRGVIQDFLVEITQEAIPSQMLQVDDWPGPAFDLLKAYYANEGIEFHWKKFFNSYTMQAEGRSLDQLESLLPGAIAIEKLEDDQYHLNINLGEMNMFAAMVYKQTITLHGGEIINSNAPASNNAVWNNPNEVDVTFKVRSLPFSLSLMFGVVIILILVAIMFFVKFLTRPKNDFENYI